jgi:cytoskeletal protein RodZ
MKKILLVFCSIMILTIFAPHDAFAKNFTVKLSESMTLDSGDDKPADKKKKETKKTTTKKDTKKIETKKDVKKDTKKKELTKAKGKKTWKKIVHPPKYNLAPE